MLGNLWVVFHKAGHQDAHSGCHGHQCSKSRTVSSFTHAEYLLEATAIDIVEVSERRADCTARCIATDPTIVHA